MANKTSIKAAEVLRDNRPFLMEKWEAKAREEMSEIDEQSSIVLRNHLVEFITNLEGALTRFTEKKHETSEESCEINHDVLASKSHGRSRASTRNFTIERLIDEYSFLRRIICEKLQEEKAYNARVAEILFRQTELSVKHATTEFFCAIKELQQRISASLSHDLKNPLQSNMYAVDLLEEGSLEEGSRRKIYDSMKRNQDRMSDMLTELLESLDVKPGEGMAFTFKEVDLREHLAATKEEAQFLYPDKVDFHIPDTPIVGFFDHGAIARMIENLISNAFKYGDHKSKVTVALEDLPDRVLVEVHNCGDPIPEDEKERIFRFLNKGSKGEGKPNSWGIGLAVVDAVSRAHDGKVVVESSKEKGTKFKVYLSKTSSSRPHSEIFVH